MAWNEPGGGNKDPWGKNNQDGPPDLDEVFKNVQSKVSDIFGKGKPNGGSPSGSGIPGRFGALGGSLLFIVLVIAWLATGVYIIQPAERGVITQFADTPAPHWQALTGIFPGQYRSWSASTLTRIAQYVCAGKPS